MQVLLFKVPRPIKGRRQVFLQSEKDIMIKLTKQSFKNRLMFIAAMNFVRNIYKGF